jgi:hypothetical protein
VPPQRSPFDRTPAEDDTQAGSPGAASARHPVSLRAYAMAASIRDPTNKKNLPPELPHPSNPGGRRGREIISESDGTTSRLVFGRWMWSRETPPPIRRGRRTPRPAARE